jgi:phosphoserine aminotransferase
MPQPGEVEIRPNSRYLHVTSNETINGIRMTEWPDTAVPLVGDMSSDFLSRTIPWDRFDVVYGGAQKNLGPAGLTIVFVRESALAETNRDLAGYLRWDIHAAKNSLYNTPPVFAIYMMGKTLSWIQSQGGLPAMEAAAAARAGLVYRAIDESDGFYRSPVDPAARSLMNVVFRLPDEESEARFVAEAEERRLLNLKGHRSVGGIRASLYNAMPMSGVEALASFMESFR